MKKCRKYQAHCQNHAIFGVKKAPFFRVKELGYFSLKLPEPNSSFLNKIFSGMVKSNYIKPEKKFSDVLPPLHHFRRDLQKTATFKKFALEF